YATKIFDNSGRFNLGGQSLDDLVRRAYNQGGARISSNSWGSIIANGAYDIQAQTFDQLVRDADRFSAGTQQMTFVVSAGNSGPFPTTVTSPATAKNVISVGASENCDHGVLDG